MGLRRLCFPARPDRPQKAMSVHWSWLQNWPISSGRQNKTAATPALLRHTSAFARKAQLPPSRRRSGPVSALSSSRAAEPPRHRETGPPGGERNVVADADVEPGAME